jgi:putative heme transporter
VSRPPARRSPARRWLGAGITIVLLVAVFGFLLPKLADYDEAWDALGDLDVRGWTALVLVAAWNLVALVPLVMVSLPGLRFKEAFVNMTAGTAVANSVPGGSAIGVGVNWAMFDSWGFTPAEYTLATLVSGVWNNFVKLGLPVIALVLLAITGDLRGSFVPAAIVGVAVMAVIIVGFALLLRSDRLAAAIGERVGVVVSAIGRRLHHDLGSREQWAERAVDFRERSVNLIRRRWVALTATSLIGHLSLWLVLLVAVRAVGISEAEVSWTEVLAAFAFVRLISAIPITPGGLGVVELGLTAALASGQPSTVANQAAAAVLLYRALTYLLPIPIGVGCYLYWRISQRRHPGVDRRNHVRRLRDGDDAAPAHR